MAAGRGIGLIVLVIVAGLVVGSLLGEILGLLLPRGVAHDLLTRGPAIGRPVMCPAALATPATLDLRVLTLTFGSSSG